MSVWTLSLYLALCFRYMLRANEPERYRKLVVEIFPSLAFDTDPLLVIL
jgi:hypothetical protein